MPRELAMLLATHSLTQAFQIRRAVAEMPLQLDHRKGRTRQCDLVIFGQSTVGKVLVGVEAKADEALGPRIEEYRAKLGCGESKIPERIDTRVQVIFQGSTSAKSAAVYNLRYQLLQGVGGVIAEAYRQRAEAAVFVVHEFCSAVLDSSKLKENASDLGNFVSLLPCGNALVLNPGRLAGPFLMLWGESQVSRPIQLLIGKVVTELGPTGIAAGSSEDVCGQGSAP